MNKIFGTLWELNKFDSTLSYEGSYSMKMPMPRKFRNFDTLTLYGRKCLHGMEATRRVDFMTTAESVNGELGIIVKLFEHKFGLTFRKKTFSYQRDERVFDHYIWESGNTVDDKIILRIEPSMSSFESYIELRISFTNRKLASTDRKLESKNLTTTQDSGIDAL